MLAAGAPPAPRRRRSPRRVSPGGGDAPGKSSAAGWVEPQQQGVGGHTTDDRRQKRGSAHTETSRTLTHGGQKHALPYGRQAWGTTPGRVSQTRVQWLIPSPRWLQHSWSSRQARAGPVGGTCGRGLPCGRGLAWAGPGAGLSLLVKRLPRSQTSPGTRSSVPTRQTRCGPGSGGEGGPRVGIRPGVGASGVPSLSVQVQNLESKSQGQTWRLRSGLSCHEAGSPKGQHCGLRKS